MPAHVVCSSCGWREPVHASAPVATRTWDSTRDEVRYRLEKKRRLTIEDKRQQVMAALAGPPPRRARRPAAGRGTVVHMKPAVGE